MVGVWEGLNLGYIPNFFLSFGMHPKIIDVHPKLIPKGGVVQFCLQVHVLIDKGLTKSGMDEDRLKVGLNNTHSGPEECFPEQKWNSKTKPEYPEYLEYILNPK